MSLSFHKAHPYSNIGITIATIPKLMLLEFTWKWSNWQVFMDKYLCTAGSNWKYRKYNLNGLSYLCRSIDVVKNLGMVLKALVYSKIKNEVPTYMITASWCSLHSYKTTETIYLLHIPLLGCACKDQSFAWETPICTWPVVLSAHVLYHIPTWSNNSQSYLIKCLSTDVFYLIKRELSKTYVRWCMSN